MSPADTAIKFKKEYMLRTIDKPEALFIFLTGILDCCFLEKEERQFFNLINASHKNIVLDMSGAKEIFPQCLRMLLSAAKILHNKNLELIILCQGENIKDAITLSGLDKSVIVN